MGAVKRAHEAGQAHLAAGAEHPCAAMPLNAFQSVTAICGDCGHTAVLDRDRLSAMAAVPDFGTLWRHAYCAECRAEGSPRRNVVLHPMLLGGERAVDQWAPHKLGSDLGRIHVARRNLYEDVRGSVSAPDRPSAS